jgi:transposase
MLLWEEYRQGEPDDYRYSRWCELYRAWESRLSPTMRQAHPAGERMFVDYAGQTIDLTDGRTGETQPAQIFVAVMGASNYTYAEATLTQSLPDWIGAHVRALAFMGGVPAQLVPDNPKVGVDRANWYEPGLNRTYLDLATHYRTAILPTRARKPRDKAKVEVAVLVVERWILARLRNHRFFSLAELNQAIAELVADLNARPMRRLGVSRRDLFLELDRPALKELPAEPLSIRRVANAPGRARLPRRYRWALLLGTAPADPRAARCAHHRAHDRAVLQRRAGSGAHARRRPRAAHDNPRAHAERAPALCRVDDRAHRHRCGGNRP